MTQTPWLFQLGVAVFAVTGVLAAARKDMDVLGLVVVGSVTALGGGTLRDLLLGVRVFWLADVSWLYVAAAASVATFFFERWFRATQTAFLHLDALATAMFVIPSVDKTLALGFSPTIAVVMGAATGVGGGLLRDVLTARATILLGRELYITPILVGTIPYAALAPMLPGSRTAWAIVCAAIIAGLRMGAIRYNWTYPDWLVYRERGDAERADDR